jgi:hypothetical protein
MAPLDSRRGVGVVVPVAIFRYVIAAEHHEDATLAIDFLVDDLGERDIVFAERRPIIL